MTKNRTQGVQQRAEVQSRPSVSMGASRTPGPIGTALAGALALAMAGAIAAPAAKVQGASSEGAAGEAAAQGYYVQNRATFATYLPAITLGQTAAALAEGELEGPRAGRHHPLSEGDAWTLPGRFVAPEGGLEWVWIRHAHAPDMGAWKLLRDLRP